MVTLSLKRHLLTYKLFVVKKCLFGDLYKLQDILNPNGKILYEITKVSMKVFKYSKILAIMKSRRSA